MMPAIQAWTTQDPSLGALNESITPHLTFPTASTWWESPFASSFYGAWYALLKPALTLTIIATLVLMVATLPMRWPALTLFVIVLSHHAITAVFAENDTRYSDQVLPVTVILAAMGLIASRRALGLLSRREPPTQGDHRHVVSEGCDSPGAAVAVI
jgi:hypothetical protein